MALRLESRGGGGGAAQSASTSLDTAYGKAIGNAGSGGLIDAVVTGRIRSAGAGIVAQSLGGDGGVAGDACASVVGGVLSVAVGGNAGRGGDGGAASVANGGIVQTTGDNAFGLDVQSIGGGSGGAASSLTVGVQLTIASAVGGHGGTGGTALARNDSQIVTQGANSTGMSVQSVGGGGGHGGTSSARTIRCSTRPSSLRSTSMSRSAGPAPVAATGAPSR